MSIQTSYGSVWEHAADNIAAILDADIPSDERLRNVIELGYFSQFTSCPSLAFNELLVTWLEQHILDRYGVSLEEIPVALAELEVVPSATLVRRRGRTVSPDLMRYVAYAMQLQTVWPIGPERADVLEIGSGYGGLARTLQVYHPNSRFWLADIPESLRCAEIYLRAAFPEKNILWLNENDAIDSADFILVPAGEAAGLLPGRCFDMAINVWSFGEMPNEYVATWLKLLQVDCQVKRLFTVNSFMAPVTPTTQARTMVGDWLLGLDERWAIDDFEIDFAVHRCPLMRNFPKGIGIIARRIDDENEVAVLRRRAAAGVRAVLREDWVVISAEEKSATTPERPERMLSGSTRDIDPAAVSSQRLLAVTDYVGHFNIESNQDGAFFCLWNDWRMTGSQRSGALLIAYLAMVGKANLESRCTKEELLLLKRLSPLPLHLEYNTFRTGKVGARIEHDGDWLTDQEACDRAMEHKKASKFDVAEMLLQKVAAVYPAHGDCWFQMAQLAEICGKINLAAVFAAHSVHLGCVHYAAEATRMRMAFRARRRWWHMSAEKDPISVCCGCYLDGDPGGALAELAKIACAEGRERLESALKLAVGSYN